MALIDSISLASKFRGCLVGGLLGDCLGAPYEGDYGISKTVLQKYFDTLEGPYFKCRYIFAVTVRLVVKVASLEFMT
jgi:poly(ADP-ribose) glycohydrolase ARH3